MQGVLEFMKDLYRMRRSSTNPTSSIAALNGWVQVCTERRSAERVESSSFASRDAGKVEPA